MVFWTFQVVRAAEECAATLASYIPPAQSIRILIPIIQTSSFPINLAAIKMQTKVIELMAAPALEPLLDELMPGLLKVSWGLIQSLIYFIYLLLHVLEWAF